MGFWSYYFFAKFFLYLGKYIDFHVLPNLAFVIFLMIPLRHRWMKISRQIIAIPAGIALLYHDSWLPPATRLLAQASSLQQFNAAYLIELLGRFVNPMVVAGLAGMLLVLMLAGRKLRLSSFVVMGIILIAISGFLEHMRSSIPSELAVTTPVTNSTALPTDAALNISLRNFYLAESQRKSSLIRTDSPGKPFDIVFLHICSLAWDDMELVQQQNHPLMAKFDVVFKQFNSAASYSGPAAIRLLRGNCGQSSHEDLYKPATDQCNVFKQLEQAGFQPEWLMNHDGHFGNFREDVTERGGLDVKLDDSSSAKAGMRAFDDTPVYDDADVLGQWVQKRSQNNASQVALYYNTISLHDGNHYSGEGKLNVNDAYQQHLKKLFDDIDGFIAQLAKTGRRTVVVMVPEHGAALRGDRMQITGLREIPTPAITLVPTAIKLVGFADSPATQLTIDQPVSYLALMHVIGNFLAQNPFEPVHPSLTEYLHDLPQTAFVSENAGMVMMRQNGHDMLRNPDLSWSEYPPGNR